MRRSLRAAVAAGALGAGVAVALFLAQSTSRAAAPHNTPGSAATTGTFMEFALLTANSVPEAIVTGPDGNLWFAESAGVGAIGRITPAGTVTEFGITTPNSGAFWITAGPDGNLWFTEAYGNKIGKMSSTGAMLAEYAIPTLNSGPGNIVSGPDGNLWFTEYGGDTIGKITTAGVLTEVAHLTAGAGPSGITVGPDGNLWFDEQKANKIGKITTAGAVTEFVLGAGRTPAAIAAGSDGNLWFTEFDGNRIGKLTTAGVLTEITVPTVGSQPGSIAAGIDGNLWFTEQNGNNVARITADGTITEFGPIPTAGSGPGGITSGPDGNLWFTERLGNKIGRLTLTCDTWLGTVDGNFGTAGNWSTGAVPTSADDVCITATTKTVPAAKFDSYTIVASGIHAMHSLTLGGPNGGQTLVIPASGAEIDLSANSSIGPNGVITLGDAGSGTSSLLGCGSVMFLTNAGHLNTITGGGGNRYLRFYNLHNLAAGTVDLGGPTVDDNCGTMTNDGSFIVEAGGSFSMSGGPSFGNTGGSLTNHGAFTVSGAGGGFLQRASESGNPVVINGSLLDDDTSVVNGLFTLTGTTTLTGSGANPGIGAGQVVTIPANNSQATVPVSFTNAGTITLGDAGSGTSVLTTGCTANGFTNTGHLNTIVGGGGTRYLRGLNLNNAAGGSVDLAAATVQDNCGSTTNNGTFTIEAGGSLALNNGGEPFANTGGSLINNGAFTLNGTGNLCSYCTFYQRGGTEVGNPVVLTNRATLDDDLGAAAGNFTLSGSNNTLTGSGANPGVAAGQVVTIPANNSQANVDKAITNAGTIILGDSGNGTSALMGCGGVITLTNTGHLNTVAGGGGNRFIQFVNFLNAAGGTVDLAGPLVDDSCGTLSNNGTYLVEASGSLSVSNGPTFNNYGGSLTNNGAVTVSGGGLAAFVQRGGTESGNPVVVSGSKLDDDLGAGVGLFTLTGNTTLTGSGANPGVAAGQVVTIPANNSQATIDKSITNAGTIILGDAGGGTSAFLGCGGTTILTNTGHLNTITGGGGIRYLRFYSLHNIGAGSIDIAGPTVDDNCGTISNDGTLTIEAGASLALSGGPTFGQGPAGTFATTINANAGTFGQLTAGGHAISLDGVLKVTTVGKPVVGSNWPIIANANRTAMFANHDFGYWNYGLLYPATGVTLVAQNTCDVWIGGVDNNFATAANWSLGFVPTSTDDACINATTTTIVKANADTYTVFVNGDLPVKSLTLGGPNGTQTLAIPSGSRLTLLGNSSMNAHGVMVLGDAGNGDAWLGCVPACSPTGPTLTNNGTLKTIQGGGGIRHIQVEVINAVGATLDVAGTAVQTDAGCNNPGGIGQNRAIINNGATIVEAAANFSPDCGFVNSAGATVVNNGTLTPAGAWVQRGTESGHPVLFMNGSGIDDDTSAGPGSFVYSGSAGYPSGQNSLGGSGPNPGIPAGQTIVIASTNTYIGIYPNIHNAGTIVLGDNSGTGDSALCCAYFTSGATITNTGIIKTVPGSGGIRHLEVNVVNLAGGIIDIATDTRQDQACGTGGVNATTISNAGTFMIEANARYTMSNCPAGGYQNTFTQGTGGTYQTTVDANATKFGQLTGGAVNLDGNLRVTTVGWPSLGSTWPIISGATRSGTFANSNICGPDYNIEYAPTSVTLAERVNLYSTQSTAQERLSNSNGTTWWDMDPSQLSFTFTPSVDSYAILSGNADLWTSVAGYNQDIGISVSGGVYPTLAGQPEAWKESGGYAGTFSPNAAFVQTMVFLKQGQPYTVKLVWKANKAASGATIWAGAGPIGVKYSPTRLTAQLLPASTSNLKSASITNQPTQSANDGATWNDLDPGLTFQYTPCVDGQARLSGNVDLWTSLAGYNQDVGIAVSGGSYPTAAGQPEVWKESGGNAGTFSPNAAFVQGVIPLKANTTYTFKLTWKANIRSPASAAIWAGAGPIGSLYSPTRLMLQFLPSGSTISRVIDTASTTQYTQSGSDGATWVDMDVTSATPLTFQLSSTTSCVAVLSANADLWTSVAGYNQDIGITVSGGAYPTTPGQPEAWKESGGFAGTFSPNAAYVQTVLQLTPGITYMVKVQWKTNVRSPSTAAIYTGAGAINAKYSPTRLTAQLLGCT